MPRKSKGIPQVLTEEQLSRIFKAIFQTKYLDRGIPNYSTFLKFRNCMIIYLAYYLGLRPKEAYGIKMENLDLENKELLIPAESNKQQNSDFIPLPDFVIERLKAYLKTRSKFFKKSSWLFPSLHCRSKGKLNHSVVGKIFREAVKKAGLYRVGFKDTWGRCRSLFNMYSLRHSFGSNVYDKTKDIKKTACLLRQYDWQCRSALIYIHTTQNKTRAEILQEVYS